MYLHARQLPQRRFYNICNCGLLHIRYWSSSTTALEYIVFACRSLPYASCAWPKRWSWSFIYMTLFLSGKLPQCVPLDLSRIIMGGSWVTSTSVSFIHLIIWMVLQDKNLVRSRRSIWLTSLLFPLPLRCSAPLQSAGSRHRTSLLPFFCFNINWWCKNKLKLCELGHSLERY